MTNKARTQPKERIDEQLAKVVIPPRPMLELEAGSNVWYQAYVMKETINEVKVRFPGERQEARERAVVGGLLESVFGCWRSFTCSTGFIDKAAAVGS